MLWFWWINGKNKYWTYIMNSEFNNLYKFLINSKQLSSIIIPLALIIIYNKKYINYFNYWFVYIACIGIIDNNFQYKKHKSLFVYYSVS